MSNLGEFGEHVYLKGFPVDLAAVLPDSVLGMRFSEKIKYNLAISRAVIHGVRHAQCDAHGMMFGLLNVHFVDRMNEHQRHVMKFSLFQRKYLTVTESDRFLGGSTEIKSEVAGFIELLGVVRQILYVDLFPLKPHITIVWKPLLEDLLLSGFLSHCTVNNYNANMLLEFFKSNFTESKQS